MSRCDEAELSYLQHYVAERQGKQRRAQSAGQLLSQLMARRGYAQVLVQSELETAWREAVGERLADQSRCGTLRRGLLFVVVASSTAMQEIVFQKQMLIRKLNRSNQKQKIKDLRCRIGPID